MLIPKCLGATAVAIALTSLSLWGYQLANGISAAPWPLLLNAPLKVSAALILLLLLSAFIVYDVISIFLFRYGFEQLNSEITICEGPEGAPPRKISTRNKLTVGYSVFFLSNS